MSIVVFHPCTRLERWHGLCALLAGALFFSGLPSLAAEPWRVGFAKVDVTPDEPLRLSGYAVRVESHVGVADPLAARVMVISPSKSADDAQSLVMVSIDSIGVTSAMTVALAKWLQEEYAIPRNQLVVSSTHSHAAPHVDGLLRNLYRQPSTPEQEAATRRYTDKMSATMQRGITAAMASRQPANLSIGQADAQFAINRRVLKNGAWSGFGEQADGVVDHRVRLMVARDPSGALLGASFLYACHCTTLGGDFNQISGDWAGLSAGRLEQLHPGTVFLPVIGCGADANPNPRGNYEMAQQHAAELVTAIDAQLEAGSAWTPLAQDPFPVAHFGYAGLAPEQPTAAYLQQMQQSELSNEKRWAEEMLAIRKEMGRLPETYPMPIHTWQFGDQLTWVFLGGEVVVDYQFQLEKELPTEQTWVAAYTDDVFAYVASERMRSEGGYEVDFSMIYYLQPGRWQSGTQSLIVRRVREIFSEAHSEERPLSALEALQSIQVPDGYQVELVAAEPLVEDPINLAFGIDGRVWVVEMCDYPLGTPGGGRVKWLRDTDFDGKLDQVQIFIQGLSYPTSVMPWRQGVLIIAAPHVLFAEDTDGDGSADHTEPWLTGIDEANPQHRASGFEIGLDGWLHFAGGHGTKQLISHRNATTYEVGQRDIAWNPDTGEIRTQAGETQFVRSRDNFGTWFGNNNSQPMFQFVVEDRYLQGQTLAGRPKHDLLSPPVAPPVYPRSRTLDRFNDLYALNRFTSACSSMVIRVPGVSGPDQTSALVCEPVHNLVARLELAIKGSCYTATHRPDNGRFDFFTSTDPWSRPVRAINAPDGSVWIVDMVRRVIEHPEWIPTAWQQRLDLRGGEQLGRIYRVVRKDYRPLALRGLSDNARDLLPALASENGAIRDLALQAIMQSPQTKTNELQKDVRRIAAEHASPEVRATALGCLSALGWLTADDLTGALQADDPRLVRFGLELAERVAQPTRELSEALNQVVARELGPPIDLQWVLTSTQIPQFDARAGLTEIVGRAADDPWILKAISLVRHQGPAVAAIERLLELYSSDRQLTPAAFDEVERCFAQLWQRCDAADRQRLATTQLQPLLASSQPHFSNGQLLLLSSIAQANEPNEQSNQPRHADLSALLGQVTKRVVNLLQADQLSEAEQLTFINLLGSKLAAEDVGLEMARAFMDDEKSLHVRRTTLEALRRMRGMEVAEMLIAQWGDLNSTLRATAGATLLSRREWAAALVDALERGTIPTGELDLTTLGQLSTYSDRELRNRSLELFGQPTDRAQVVARYLTDIPAPVGTDQGERLFTEHCAACHRTADGKPQLGPPLENLNHWTLDQWVTAVLDPNQTVEPKYRQSTLLTADGQVTTGLILERGPRELLVGISDGSLKRMAVDDIEDEKDAGPSLMPVGFEQKLSPQQLSELIGFLRGRR